MIKTQIIDFVASHNRPVRRFEILRYLFSLKGRTFDPVRDRGYYSDHFYTASKYMPQFRNQYIGYLMKPSTKEPRYLKSTNKGYVVA